MIQSIKTNNGNLMLDSIKRGQYTGGGFYLVIQDNDGYGKANIEVENTEQAQIIIDSLKRHFEL